MRRAFGGASISTSMIIVITGDGKGKTTSALGQAMRAVGNGKRVLMAQFIKGPWKSGEDESFKRLAPEFEIVKTGKGFVGILGDTLPREEHAKAAQDGLVYVREQMLSGKWDVVVLDEIHNAVDLGLVSVRDVLAILDELPQNVDAILTGRGAPRELIECADIVSEVKEIKHAFHEGEKAKRGIEF